MRGSRWEQPTISNRTKQEKLEFSSAREREGDVLTTVPDSIFFLGVDAVALARTRLYSFNGGAEGKSEK